MVGTWRHIHQAHDEERLVKSEINPDVERKSTILPVTCLSGAPHSLARDHPKEAKARDICVVSGPNPVSAELKEAGARSQHHRPQNAQDHRSRKERGRNMASQCGRYAPCFSLLQSSLEAQGPGKSARARGL